MVSNFAILTKMIFRSKMISSSDLILEVEMSNKDRLYHLVSHAVCDLTSGMVDGYEVWASATAVGENAEVSTGTARKYLERLCEEGFIEKKSFMGISGYRVPGNVDPRCEDLS